LNELTNFFANRTSKTFNLSRLFFPAIASNYNPGLSILIDEPNTANREQRSRIFLKEIKQQLGNRIYQRILSGEQRVNKGLSFYNDDDSQNMVKLSMYRGAPCLGGGSWEVGEQIGSEYYNDETTVMNTAASPAPINNVKVIDFWRWIDGATSKIIVEDTEYNSGTRGLKNDTGVLGSLITDVREYEDYFSVRLKYKLVSPYSIVTIYLYNDAAWMIYCNAYNAPLPFGAQWNVLTPYHSGGGGSVVVPNTWQTMELRVIKESATDYRFRVLINGSSVWSRSYNYAPMNSPSTKLGFSINGVAYVDELAYTYETKDGALPAFTWFETYGDLINLVREVGVNSKPFWDFTGTEFDVTGLNGDGNLIVKNRNFSQNYQGNEYAWFESPYFSASLVIEEIILPGDNTTLEYQLPEEPVALIDFSIGIPGTYWLNLGFNAYPVPYDTYSYQDADKVKLNKAVSPLLTMTHVRIRYVKVELSVGVEKIFFGRKITGINEISSEKELIELDEPFSLSGSTIINNIELGGSDGARLLWKLPFVCNYTFTAIELWQYPAGTLIPPSQYTVDYLNNEITLVVPLPAYNTLRAVMTIQPSGGGSEMEITAIKKAGFARLVRISDDAVQFKFHTDSKYETILNLQEVKPKQYDALKQGDDYIRP